MPIALDDGTRLYTRKEIGYRHGRGRKGRALRTEWIEHTAVSGTGNLSVAAEMALCRAYERYHVNTRGMAGIAYSFLTGDSGTAYEGRGWDYDGSHTQNGGNTRGYANCHIGDGTKAPPTPQAWAAVRALIRDGVLRNKLTEDYRVSGHGDWWDKECPGRHIRDHMDDELSPERALEEDIVKPEDIDAIATAVAAKVEKRVLTHLEFRDKVHWNPQRHLLDRIARKLGVSLKALRKPSEVDPLEGDSSEGV